MKLSEAAEIFYTSMIGVKAESTVKWYQNRLASLIDFLQDPEADQISLQMLERFRASLNRPSRANGRKGKISPYTIHSHVRVQKRFFGFLYRRQIIEKNPTDFLEKPKLPKQPRKGISPQAAEKIDLCCYCSINPDFLIMLSDNLRGRFFVSFSRKRRQRTHSLLYPGMRPGISHVQFRP